MAAGYTFSHQTDVKIIERWILGMGCIRIFLAISVVMAHMGMERKFGLVSGKIAVELFFGISGFYMAMVISRYLAQPRGIGSFYKARYLRLFPAYIVTLLLFIIFYRPIVSISNFSPVVNLYNYFVSFTMIGFRNLKLDRF